MSIQLKPQTKKWAINILLYATIFAIGGVTPDVMHYLSSNPKTVRAAVPAPHTVHTATLGVPVLEDFDFGDPMYEYYRNNSGAHLEYPLTFTCGCKQRKQKGLTDISVTNLEDKIYEVRHTPISDDHDNLWFLQAEVNNTPVTTAHPGEHTATLGTPAYGEFNDKDEIPYYSMFNSVQGKHYKYPLSFTCGCAFKDQYVLSDVSYPGLEGKTLAIEHALVQRNHNNFWTVKLSELQKIAQ